jgi:hypothetical protein
MTWLVVGLAVLLVPGLATADVVELANGERVEGAAVRTSPDHVTIQVGGRTVIFGREQVRAVYFGPAPQPCGPARQP